MVKDECVTETLLAHLEYYLPVMPAKQSNAGVSVVQMSVLQFDNKSGAHAVQRMSR